MNVKIKVAGAKIRVCMGKGVLYMKAYGAL
jgi:hypothetical protein